MKNSATALVLVTIIMVTLTLGIYYLAFIAFSLFMHEITAWILATIISQIAYYSIYDRVADFLCTKRVTVIYP